ncbi:DNA alkylation repair protein [Aurantibacter aestuarii]|uniref:DNA alkylation repair protein n=1 Tax=Aurantibacter aestuarii TaxID=1266046 RepID=A0A2T1N6V8_9FLAO|nr:DNA alkylation repair protein [Aurantibacter aestuarii]PSG87311.1 DNA alkylation repair protein [Aurantibacter aestuarii]
MKAEDFIKKLTEKSGERSKKDVLKFFKEDDNETDAIGVKFGTVFKLAKEFTDLPLTEINNLLDSKYYEIRMGAVSIMDFQAKKKSTSEERRKELYELYLNRHDRLNNWDFVDRGAYNIIGEYLVDKPKNKLYELAKSKNPWERRTAIVSTYAFIKKGQIDDTFKIAEILVDDEHELINKAVGSWIREAGKKDQKKLKSFLDKHAKTMPRVTLRYAIEKFDEPTRQKYLNKGK